MDSPTKKQREAEAAMLKAGLASRPDVTTQVKRPPGKLVKDVFQLSVDRIRVDKDQVRKDGKSKESPRIQELAASIDEVGLLQYPQVRYIEEEDIYQIVAGEGRYTACVEILGWEELSCQVVDVADEKLSWMQIHENLHRRALSPWDLASAVEKARSDGMTIAQIADKLKKSRGFVQQAVTVSEHLTEEARKALQDTPQGQSLGVVYQVATLHENEQLGFARDIVEKDLKKEHVISLASQIKQNSKDKTRRRRGGKKATAKPREESFKVSGGATITVKFRRKNVTDEEVTAALQEALQSIARGKAA